MIVLKFGGTSVADGDRVREAAAIAAAQPRPRVVVVSAAGGVTNRLLEAARSAAAGSPTAETVAGIRGRHAAIAASIADPSDRARAEAALDALDAALEAALADVAAAGDLAAQDADRIVATGEKAMSVLMAATLRALGTPASHVFADRVVGTDDRFGGARLDRARTRAQAQEVIRPLLDRGETVVVTGFIGAAPDGSTSTLGRGGSDYSATILGAALDADEVQIWTDVPGVLSADPRQVPSARVVPQVSYDEAQELAHFGAKVLHPRTIRPAVARGIPVRILSTFAPQEPGTVVAREATGDGVKAITALRGLVLLTVDVPELEDLSGAAAVVFGALHADGAEVAFAAQASSRRRMTFLVDGAGSCGRLRERIEVALDVLPFGDEVEVACTEDVAVVAAVGAGAAGQPAMMGRVLEVLGQAGVPVLAANQQDSNVALVAAVPAAAATRAVEALHRELIPAQAPPPTALPRRRPRRADLLAESLRVG
ncbi:MAG: Aspartokinase [uncultured Thermomicrobiales bacterium]|uniref:Aspartokinase n=1 Tax=uncultured Thermomicrobiales bacterium TaxID=1645740 RepID=A0A6J4UQQ7_9BACT|nr:MAG: Aspartokinase [uncultured Thermomicrobiales bacterium]